MLMYYADELKDWPPKLRVHAGYYADELEDWAQIDEKECAG